jgi:hypothetical protein
MRIVLRCSTLLMGVLLLTNKADSQTDRFTYAVTDLQQDGANWSVLRKLNLQNGQYSDVLLDGNVAAQKAFDAMTKQELTSFTREANRGYNTQPAFSSGVAAMAYDTKNNRIWYTPMFIDQLRYIDLKTMKVYYVTSQDFTGMAKKSADQGNIITRMTIADDGQGYALTNDGAHLIRFSTTKKLVITDMGNLADDPNSKGGVSIHSSCSSFGGDIVADNQGNLIVFSARNQVFSINIETKVANNLGIVSNVPVNFTTNGAAVTADNKIILTSAVDGNAYVVEPSTWSATPYKVSMSWRSSDLANSNILNTKKTVTNDVTASKFPVIIETGSDLVQVYPNPVTASQFNLLFSKLTAGDYSLQVTDVMGKQIIQRRVTVTGTDQTETVRLSEASSKGFYLVNILDKNNKSVFSKKLIVQ